MREFDLVVEALQHRDRAAERQHREAPGAGEVLEALDHMIRAPVRASSVAFSHNNNNAA